MRAILVLAIAPVVIGFLASFLSRDARRASLIAACGSALFVALAIRITDADAAIGWFATLLVLPLPVACAIATVAFCVGRGDRRARGHDHHVVLS